MISETQSILHYTDVRQIGEGGMGVVYRALDTRLDRQVALKFLPDGAAVRDDAKQRLITEAKAAANLDHPNIGVIHGIEEADGHLFIVMALYRGETLEARLSGGPLSPLEVAELGLQAARGLAKAHDAGVIHRDIKPANLFLTEEGLLKILDFGLVKVEAAQGLTVPGTIVGTPEYMAPEQIRGQQPDRRADLWGLGVVLYELLTGVSPFRSEGGFAATIMQVMSTTPPPLAEHAPDFPPAFQDVLDRAIAKDAEERYASAREVAADLERIVAGLRARHGEASSELRSGRIAPLGPGAAGPGAAGPRTGAGGSTGARSVVDLTVGRPGASQVSALLEPVPRVPSFVGRGRELAALRARLEREHVVAIRGMAGGGKSVLGARLAREGHTDDHICWFTFDPVEKNTVDALFWSLAAFLAQRGEPLLWKYLQGEIEAHRPLDRTVRLNLFNSSLGSTGCVFCLDDVHLVARDPDVTEVLKAFQRLVAGSEHEGAVSFIFMGRELPRDLEHRAVSLGGFTRAEVKGLVESHGLELPASVVDRLTERTHGNPTLLELAAGALAGMGDDHDAMTAFVESMAGKSDIRDYVMNHVYADLKPHEKSITEALSIFRGPIGVDAVEEILSEGGLEGIVACVEALMQKSVVHETDKGEIYCHDLVREFCYRRLEVKVKRRLHAHAASYYEAADNPLLAAYHTFEQGDGDRALSLLTDNLKGIIDGGGASSVLEALARFDASELDDDQQLALVLARGEALTIRGDYREAIRLFESALDDVLEEEGRAELLCRLGSVSNDLGEHDRAIVFARESLDAYDVIGYEVGQARVQRVIGMAHFRMGRLVEARAAFTAGMERAEASHDTSLAAYLDQYIGLVDTREDLPDEARRRFERSRKAFRAARDRHGEAEAIGNLAVVHGILGNGDRELSLYGKVLEILEAVGDVGYLLILYNNLGRLEQRAGRYDEAARRFEQLVELARRSGHRLRHGEGLVGLAETYLAAGRVDVALDRADAAHELLDGLPDVGGPPIELAMSRRVLGEIRLAMGEPDLARSWFESSIPVLEEANEAEELEKARRGLSAVDASGTSRAGARTTDGATPREVGGARP